MFMKCKSILATGILSLGLAQTCLSENISDGFVFGGASVGVYAVVYTDDGASIDVNTRWSGLNGQSGFSQTADGSAVEWGYFYVDPNQVAWGSPSNPDLYVKVWYDKSGRIDVNCFHVSVPDISCGAMLLDENNSAIANTGAEGLATTNNRYVRLTLEPGAGSFQ